MEWGGESAIDDALVHRSDGRVTAVVQLTEPELTASSPSGRIDQLQANARQAQRAVRDFAGERDGVRLRSQFWITNAITLEIDTRKVDLEELVRIPGVERVHENFEVEPLASEDATPEAADGEASTLADGDYTYGLQQVQAPAVWDQFGTQGSGARVAVLDTGIDPDHPDIDLAPDGWAEFDENGNQIDSEPYDSDQHGTHVSGTVSGGAASGEHIGVAPAVELYHGGVLTDNGGTWSAVVAGIEWAVTENADVINMSLGTPGGGYTPEFITPLQNAMSAGTLPVCASGNSYEGSSGSPANVYGDSLAVGATNSAEAVTDFSSGEKVVTADDWGSDAPDDWPAEYIVPDVAAPGENVKSSIPGGGYDSTFSGTSMASPHVTGIAALMVSASGGDTTPEQIWDALESTAWKPDDWDESQANAVIDGKDTRYGLGITDALAAVQQVALDTGATGVVESEGQPVEGATVELDGFETTTDETGSFTVITQPGEYDLTIAGPGIQETVVTITVEDSGALTNVGTITVDPALVVEVTDSQPAKVEGGEAVPVTIDVYNLETLRVDLTGTYSESDAGLMINGEPAEFGTTYEYDDFTGEIPMGFETTPDTSGEAGLDLVATGAGDQSTVATGPTTIFESLFDIGVVDADDLYGSDIAQTLEEQVDETYRITQTTSDLVITNPGEFAAVVVQKLDGNLVEDFVQATTNADVGTVYLDQWGDDADAIPQFATVSNAVTATYEDDSFGDAEGSVYFEATESHPVLGELSIGDDVVVHTGQYLDHSWFELASDSDFEVLADVKHDAGTSGSAIAVETGARTVLASTLGRSQFVSDSEFTGDADTILGLSVRFAADNLEETTVSATVSYNAGQAQLSLDCDSVSEILVDSLWVDWEARNADFGDAFTDNIPTEGTCSWNWGDDTKTVAPSLTLDIPTDTYLGGTYAVSVTGSGPNGSDETTVTFDMG